jgi:hypothetical protein
MQQEGTGDEEKEEGCTRVTKAFHRRCLCEGYEILFPSKGKEASAKSTLHNTRIGFFRRLSTIYIIFIASAMGEVNN